MIRRVMTGPGSFDTLNALSVLDTHERALEARDEIERRNHQLIGEKRASNPSSKTLNDSASIYSTYIAGPNVTIRPEANHLVISLHWAKNPRKASKEDVALCSMCTVHKNLLVKLMICRTSQIENRRPMDGGIHSLCLKVTPAHGKSFPYDIIRKPLRRCFKVQINAIAWC